MENRFFIGIGINDYDMKPLSFCAKDVEDLARTMFHYCDVSQENSFLITSTISRPNAGVKLTLDKCFKRIATKFQPLEDSLFFYFSGHGAKNENSTALVFHDQIVLLQEIFDLCLSLKPKFMFYLIDSCYSGVGVKESGSKSDEELLFSQHLKIAEGYNIICASADDAPAKEDGDIKNGRLTRLFIDVISNQSHYKAGILSLSKVYMLMDEAFKNNPIFRQFPFAQTKGLSTYPIAYRNIAKEEYYFATHYILSVDDYNWDEVKNEMSLYLKLDPDIINELTRVTRELIRNALSWGKATFLKLEIGHRQVSIIHNSDAHFDIFNPPDNIQINGGGKTAAMFKKEFGEVVLYEGEKIDDLVCETFSFLNPDFDLCTWSVFESSELKKFMTGTEIVIPNDCEEYLIRVPQGFIDLSTVNVFLMAAIESSNKYSKPIKIFINEKDRLKAEFIAALDFHGGLKSHKVSII
jgi:hypothetical protein